MDLTGRFPHCSSRGNEYVLIAHDYDSNGILGTPLKNRQAAIITAAWKLLYMTSFTELESLPTHGFSTTRFLKT